MQQCVREKFELGVKMASAVHIRLPPGRFRAEAAWLCGVASDAGAAASGHIPASPETAGDVILGLLVGRRVKMVSVLSVSISLPM
jgi:hypothetical protein